MNIGQRLKEARKKAGLTQKRLAEIAGLSAGAYSTYEVGTRELSLATLVTLTKALGVSADWLLGLTDDMEIQEPVEVEAEPVPSGPYITTEAMDESGAPLINCGDAVNCIPRQAKEGDLICAMSDNRPVYGRLINGWIVPTNPAYPPVREFTPLGPVHRIIKTVVQ